MISSVTQKDVDERFEFEVSQSSLLKRVRLKQIMDIYNVFLESLNEAKEKYGSNTLKSLFDYYDKPISGFFSPFFYLRRNRLNNIEIQMFSLFKQFAINEEGRSDVFNFAQRSKLSTSLLENILNISTL